MTAIPVRHTPYASWKDSDAWMESMKGPAWNSILKEEEQYVNYELNKPQIQKRIGPFLADFKAAQDAEEYIPFVCGSMRIEWHSQFTKSWSFLNSNREHQARDLVCNDSYVWSTEDVGDGAELFQLQCWNGDKLVWKKIPVGPDVGLKSNKIYYLGVKNKLIYHELWCCDAMTGKDAKLIYTEKNPEVNLSLEKQADGRIILVKDNSQDTEFFEITDNGLKKQSARFNIPRNWKLPSGEYGISFVWPRLNLLITKRYGSKILWKCTSYSEPKIIIKIPAGQIQIDPFLSHYGKADCLVRVITPSKYTANYRLYANGKISLLAPIQPTGLISKSYSSISADGTEVHGILTYDAFVKPKNLLIIGYGAYGLETGVSSVLKRWAPLVRNGWAIGYTFIRGGGDHTEEWGKAGRRAGRIKTIEDYNSLIKKAQEILQISSKNTVIYGRSAGGLLMGATLASSPDGSLMRGVYTEVPYVDVLRTTTNNDLPLTALEYNEFGNPMKRFEDFISVGCMSPADSATMVASPDIFVLTRTAENDSQVFAYESIKWIRRLRNNTNVPKICIVERDQGHFTPPEKTILQWAVDCALLDGLIQDGTR